MNYDDFCEIIYGDNEGYKLVTEEEIYDQSRWSVYKSCVVQQRSTQKYFECWWGEGATEQQEGQDEPFGMVEVFPKEVVQTVYERVENGINIEGEH